VTSLFRATCGVSLEDRERTQNERQAVYDGRQDSDLTSGGQWSSDSGRLSRTQPLGGQLPSVEAAIRANGDQRSAAAERAGAREQRAEEDVGGVAVEESRTGVCLRKKTLSPGQRRDLAQRAVAAQLCSGRSACQILHLARSTDW